MKFIVVGHFTLQPMTHTNHKFPGRGGENVNNFKEANISRAAFLVSFPCPVLAPSLVMWVGPGAQLGLFLVVAPLNIYGRNYLSVPPLIM